MIPSTSSPHCHQDACAQEHPKPLAEKFLVVLEKVSFVALAVFAAAKGGILFAPTFAAGMAIGLIWGDAMRGQSDAHHKGCATCSNGFMEQLTGVKLPWGIGLAANVAILAAHIDHHAVVFVPIIGVTTGIYTGVALRPPLCSLGHKIIACVRAPYDRYMERLAAVLIHIP